MSLGNDFLTLIELLWDIEEFNMWNLQAHSSIAYILDGMYGSERYDETYRYLLKLAQKKNYNEFAWEVSKITLEVYRLDSNVVSADIDYMERVVAAQAKRYSLKQLYVFGFVDEKYVPDWFFELFHSYLKVEEIKRDTMIRDYLIKQCDMSPKRAEKALQKLASQLDILLEFYFFVKNGRFKEVHPVTVKKISAKHLVETTYLSPLGAYNYLIYLRESPEEALEDLRKKLPRK